MALYETEIEIGGKNTTDGAFGAIAASLLGLKTSAGEVEAGIGRVSAATKTLRDGMVALIELDLGGRMAKSLEKWIDKAQELTRIHNEMVQIGAGAQVSDFNEQSRVLSQQYRNLSITELQKGMRDAIPIFGDASKAANEFGAVAEFMSTMKAKFGAEHGGEINRQVQAAIKAAEESGAMKPEDVGGFLKNEQKMLFAFGDQVSPSQMLTVQRNLGAYQKDLDDHFRFGILPAMAINQGQRAGTEIATAAAKVVAGIRNSSGALGTMLDLGMVGQDDLEFDDKGKPVRMKLGHKTEMTDDYAKDPLAAVTKDLLPRIIEKYGNDPIVMRQVIGRMFGDKTAISGITDLAINAQRYEKDAANVERVDPNFQRYRDQSGDYARQSIEAQKDNIEVALGMPATGPVRDIMNIFAKAESAVADAALRHPDVTAFGTAITAVGGLALQAVGAITGALVAARLLGVGGAAAAGGGVSLGGIGSSIMGALGRGGSMLKGGLVGGALYGGGSWAIDQLVPWLGGHSKEEHERLQKQGPVHFWSGLFGGDAEAAERPLPPVSDKREGTDRSYHRLDKKETLDFMKQLFPGLSPISFSDDNTGLNAMEQAVAKGTAAGFGQVLSAYGGGAGGAGADFSRAGGGGFIKASYEDGGGSGGGLTKGGWWTPERQQHAVDVLMAKGGLTQSGAEALVSRWRNVESSGGPDSVNARSGAHGIAQWLDRNPKGSHGGFDDQLGAVASELNSTEWLAKRRLNGPNPAAGASTYERAEGYNPRTGTDNFTRRTQEGMERLHDAIRKAPPKTAAPIVIHHNSHLDGEIVARSVSHYQEQSSQFATAIGTDTRARYYSPGDAFNDAA